MLGAGDVLDPPPRRVLVAGTAGVGKTTTARRIAQAVGVPHTELDALYHGPGWTVLPTFEQEVEDFTARGTWVSEWQYRQVRALLVERADTMVWLDLPRRVAFWRLLRRTVRRRLRRTVLWNGNVEPPLWTFVTRREHILRWGIAKRNEMRRQVPALADSAPHLRVVHLRSQREVERFVDRLLVGTE
ncbi:AAA family ATPase [Curtobacterium sp. MCSS17_015]|uniref:AAA family ATPase n=1 Tax=Curtobacterium sp. MCSS17_015 TaxID=2175666 RepID=UPI000DA8B762|nr:AAA family ATPase [Curtobacterium sp. MCSS17_015]WIB27357.1 AAA family ATPase [Curtobacterium sp. MCSS17_015]